MNSISECSENTLASETNNGRYTLSVVAQFHDLAPVKYIIRIEKPNGEKADFMSSLEGFRTFGELLLDLAEFAKERLYTADKEKLKEVLTAEGIRTYVLWKKAGVFKK